MTVGVGFVALAITLVAARPEVPTLSRSAVASPTTVPPTTSTSRAGLPTPAPRDVPAGPLPEVLTQVPTTDPVVFLTIDDGAVRDPAVLAQIRQAGVPVSLFLVGGEARAGAGYFADLVATGATVQNHALSHPDLRGMSLEAQTKEICGSTALTRQLFGTVPTLFRPPYGEHDANTRLAARICGFSTMVLWQATVNDGVLRIQGREHLRPGDIVLMHFRSDLSENLSVVFAALAAQGLGVGRLEDYVSR